MSSIHPDTWSDMYDRLEEEKKKLDISNAQYAKMVESLHKEVLKKNNTIMRLESEVETQRMVIQKLEEKIESLENEGFEQGQEEEWDEVEVKDLKAMVKRLEGDNNRQAKTMGKYEKQIQLQQEEIAGYKEVLRDFNHEKGE